MKSEPVLSNSRTDGVRSKDSSATPISEKPLDDRSEVSAGPKILIVEDDVALGKFLRRQLIKKDFCVEVSHDGETACDDIRETTYELIILDLNLPKMDGMAVIKHIRLSHPRLPILVLTARNRTEDLVIALERGADDYLVKPFSFQELFARIKGLLRRINAPEGSSLKVGDLTINREEHWVQRGKRQIDLTPREFALLDYLMNNAGKTASRMTLMQEVWNMPFDPTTNIVDVYMKYLRDKVDVEGEEKLIHTVRGVGYVVRNA
jgi:DNA-binding response OmpR family regulator